VKAISESVFNQGPQVFSTLVVRIALLAIERKIKSTQVHY
jgi:hypothetical protein